VTDKVFTDYRKEAKTEQRYHYKILGGANPPLLTILSTSRKERYQMPDKVSPISYVERFAKEQAEKQAEQNKEQNVPETSKEAKQNGNKHKKAENGKTES
jgi:hypothetical protein